MKTIVAIVALAALFMGWQQYQQSVISSALVAQVVAKKANNSANKVTVYGTSWCTYCAQTRAFLRKSNIPFTDFDIEVSSEGAQRYEALHGNGIPLVDVNGTLIEGHSPEQIVAALN